MIEILIVCNALVWFAPILRYRDKAFYFMLAPLFLISSGYWIYPLLIEILGMNYSVVINVDHIQKVLKYSVLAGVCFHSGFFSRRKFTEDIVLKKIDLNKLLPPINIGIFLKPIVILILIYSYYEALGMIGISDRKTFVSEIRPFWYDVLLRINALLLFIVVLFDFRKSNRVRPFYFSYFIIIFHIILVGFDGGRRDAIIPIFGMVTVLIVSYLNKGLSKKDIHRLLLMVIFSVGLSSFFALGRSLPVGWTILRSFDGLSSFDPGYFLVYILAPMPTLHVNTAMSAFVDSYGYQGISSYLSAIGNTLFPRFIFQHYLFGEPLALSLQDKFGWFGFDFGFLAEGIYSGGWTTVGVTHFILGVMFKKSLKGIYSNSVYYTFCYIALIFAITNSFRSDFMNFSKSFLYIWIALSLAYLLLNRLARLSQR
ncbi:O-antigen polymerase [Vibrio apostichopi]|uniref:O-antigen polymerase n=1 Tax=Vibrio apostichopi TaxID=3035453 RepID=UPI0025730C03|nr:O-antigen polymerase [Vibrio sp. FE10]